MNKKGRVPTDDAKFVTKDGREIPFSWLKERWAADKKQRQQLREALCRDYAKYVGEGMTEEEARAEIMRRREVSRAALNNALVSQGNGLSAKARVELEARNMVAADSQLDMLQETINQIDAIIEDVRNHPEKEYWELERIVESGGRSTIKTKEVPTVEYLLVLFDRKTKQAKVHADAIRSFAPQKSDTNINLGVVVNQGEVEARTRGVREKFGVEVKGKDD